MTAYPLDRKEKRWDTYSDNIQPRSYNNPYANKKNGKRDINMEQSAQIIVLDPVY